MRVFVLLFNARTENEGIHTIQVHDPERGPRNVVLMFESEDDATRFGLMLEAQDFPTPTVEAFEAEEIEEFCQGADYDCSFIEEGMLAVPPEKNVDKTDWQAEQSTPEESAAEFAEFAESELDRIRRRLEGLL